MHKKCIQNKLTPFVATEFWYKSVGVRLKVFGGEACPAYGKASCSSP